jgi:hypothetical protein
MGLPRNRCIQGKETCRADQRQARMNSARITKINTAIARLTYLTHGRVGRDWRSGHIFVLHDKGDEFTALVEALEALRAARIEMETLCK